MTVVICRMEDVQDLRALQEVQDEMVEQGLMKAPADAELAKRSKTQAQKQLKRKRSPAAGGSDSPYRVYESPSGYQVLIGRNHTQNDALSTRIAQGESHHMLAGIWCCTNKKKLPQHVSGLVVSAMVVMC